MSRRIAIIEDDRLTAQVLAAAVKALSDVEVRIINHPDAVAVMLDDWSPTVVLLDLTLPGRSGESVMEDLRRIHPKSVIVVTTGHNDARTAMRLVQAGAFDYLTKPLEIAVIQAAVERALRHAAMTDEGRTSTDRFVRRNRTQHAAFARFITADPRIKEVLRYAEDIAASPRAVLITGATGTGKDIVARAIHDVSERSGQYVVCNLGGLDDALVSDVLFGHRKGAFTGAISDRLGLVESAKGGTLFLDEIGDLPLPTQIKLLRLLQDGDYFVVGDDRKRQADIRVIAATSQDLDLRLADGRLRRDLYYRLASHRLHLPALCERIGDLPLLTRHLVKRAAAAVGRSVPIITADFLAALAQHEFPGNIRELDALIADGIARHRDGEPLTADDILIGPGLPQFQVSDPGKVVWPAVLPELDQVMTSLVVEALRRCQGNQTQAAKLLGVTKQAISYRMRQQAQVEYGPETSDKVVGQDVGKSAQKGNLRRQGIVPVSDSLL